MYDTSIDRPGRQQAAAVIAPRIILPPSLGSEVGCDKVWASATTTPAGLNTVNTSVTLRLWCGLLSIRMGDGDDDNSSYNPVTGQDITNSSHIAS